MDDIKDAVYSIMLFVFVVILFLYSFLWVGHAVSCLLVKGWYDGECPFFKFIINLEERTWKSLWK